MAAAAKKQKVGGFAQANQQVGAFAESELLSCPCCYSIGDPSECGEAEASAERRGCDLRGTRGLGENYHPCTLYKRVAHTESATAALSTLTVPRTDLAAHMYPRRAQICPAREHKRMTPLPGYERII